MNKKPHLIDVQPIRSKEQIEDMKWALKRHCSERDYILFIIGINTGLRVSDLLNLETNMILKLKRKRRKELKVTEGKTKKERIINLTSIFDEVYQYAQTIEGTWLFPSRKGNQPISKIQAYRQLQKAGNFAGVNRLVPTPCAKPSAIGSINKQKMSRCCKKYSITAHQKSH